MSKLSKEKVEALEALLGVKLPEGDIVVEIRPASGAELRGDELSDDELSEATGGATASTSTSSQTTSRVRVQFASPIGTNWVAKV